MADEIASSYVGPQLPWEAEQEEKVEPTIEEVKEADPTIEQEEEPVTETPVAEEAPVEEAPLTTDQAVKGGPGDYSWGGYEDKKKAKEREANRVKPPNVSQEDWDNRPEWSRPLEDVLHAGSTVGAGTLDFIFDAAGMTQIPWLRKADQWWDDNSPRSKDPFHTLIRDVSAVVVPSLVANKVLIGGAASATKARHIPQAQRTMWSILGQMGIETGIAGITSQSYEQDNAAGALNKLLGWNIPWGTVDGMNPEKRRHLHMYEAAGMSAAVDVIGAFGSFGKALRRVNMDQKSIQQLDAQTERLAQILKDPDVPPVTEAVEGTRGLRTNAQKVEPIERLSKKTDGEYDAFIN